MTHQGGWALGLCAMLGAVTVLAGARRRKGAEKAAFTRVRVCWRNLVERVSAWGEVQARIRVNVDSTLSAEVKELYVEDGQWVQAGDLLVSLDRERFRRDFNRADQRLRMAQRELALAEANWSKAEQAHWRMERLFQEKLLAMEDFQTVAQERFAAVLERERCRMAVKQAWMDLALTREALESTVIRAPVSGCVTGLQAGKGCTALAERTGRQGSALMVLSPLQELLLEVRVEDRDALKVQDGQCVEVQVEALPGRVFQGQVLSGAGFAQADPWPSQDLSVQILILAAPAEPCPLRPGMRARVLFLCPRDALTVPLQAIQKRAAPDDSGWPFSRPVVFAVHQGRVQERPLKLGRVLGQTVEVLEGLQEGEEILIGPARALGNLASGQRVRTR